MESSSFPMEKTEYNSVFKVFDKEGKGEIEINQVMDLIHNLEESAKESANGQAKPGTMKDGQATLAAPKSSSDKGRIHNAARSPGRKKNQGPLGSNAKTRDLGSTEAQDEDMMNYGNASIMQPAVNKPKPRSEEQEPTFPGGHKAINLDQLIDIIKESCEDREKADNYLVYAFSMFDRQKKGYINSDDLKSIFKVLGENVTEEEINTMIKIAGPKSNDKINYKEFVEFFYKAD